MTDEGKEFIWRLIEVVFDEKQAVGWSGTGIGSFASCLLESHIQSQLYLCICRRCFQVFFNLKENLTTFALPIESAQRNMSPSNCLQTLRTWSSRNEKKGWRK
jgi:hypothetical protein